MHEPIRQFRDSVVTRENLPGICLVLVVAGLVCLPNLGATRLWDEDEGFYASTAMEMYQRNDWVVPQFNGALFGHKPPWMYWMMMIGYSIFGVGELGARLLSGAFACLSVFFTFRIGRLLFNQRVGLIAAIVLVSSLMFTVVARSATPDSFLVCFTTIALCLFLEGLLAPGANEQLTSEGGREIRKHFSQGDITLGRMFLVYICLGLGLLTKGPIAVLFPGMIMVTVLALARLDDIPRCDSDTAVQRLVRWWTHQPRAWFTAIWQLRPITGLLTLTMIAGPWFLLVGWATGWEFHREFFGVHHWQRATKAMEGHRGSIIYYPVSILVGMYPWTVATGPVLLYWFRSMFRRDGWLDRDPSTNTSRSKGSVKQSDSRQLFAIRIVSCWILAYLAVFSIAATKLPNYVLPAYPACALVFAWVFDAWLSRPQQFSAFWHRGALGVLILTGLVIMSVVPLLALFPINGTTVFDEIGVAEEVQNKLWWLGVIGLPAVPGGIAAWIAIEKQRLVTGFVLCCSVAVATVLGLWHVVVPKLNELQNPQQLVQRLRTGLIGQPEGSLATYDFFRPTMVFYNRAPVEKCYSVQQLEAFFSKDPHGLVILDSSRLQELESSPALKFRIVQRAKRFPEKGELLVIEGWSPSVPGKPNFPPIAGNLLKQDD